MKTLFTLITLSLVAFTLYAQTSNKDFKISMAEPAVNPESKAFKNFKRSHPNVSNETWRSSNGYAFVSYVQKGVKNKIAYTRDGQVDYSLMMYNEGQLPQPVRTAVKSTYYDFNITGGQQLEVNNKTIYLVQITDGDSWKTIRLSNGELEEIENYSSVISPCR
jgi:hypothetical protein